MGARRCALLSLLLLKYAAVARALGVSPPALASWQCDTNTRFTLLTDRAVRAEYGVFEDRRSFAFAAARQPSLSGVPTFTVHNGSSWCNATVSGSGMRVSYRKFAQAYRSASRDNILTPFIRHELQLTAGAVHWSAGALSSGNLGGTISTLGGAQGPLPLNGTGSSDPSVRNSRGLPTYCTLGVASRDGWAVYNDSFNAVLDDESGWATVRPLVDQRPAPWLRQEDTYVFMYGDDYLGASAALSATSGPQPMPPRHMLGPGFSRYWQFSSVELRDIVRQMQQHGLPLDTLNLDTGWHENFCFVESIELCKKQSGKFTNKELLGYSGIFEYDLDLFPSATAADLRAWLGGLGVRSSLDVHQAAGVMPQNRQYVLPSPPHEYGDRDP
jgi:alpha-glucosidase (family GH31 glycosyl hydrolase)